MIYPSPPTSGSHDSSEEAWRRNLMYGRFDGSDGFGSYDGYDAYNPHNKNVELPQEHNTPPNLETGENKADNLVDLDNGIVNNGDDNNKDDDHDCYDDDDNDEDEDDYEEEEDEEEENDDDDDKTESHTNLTRQPRIHKRAYRFHQELRRAAEEIAKREGLGHSLEPDSNSESKLEPEYDSKLSRKIRRRRLSYWPS